MLAPPLLLSYDSLEDYLEALGPELRNTYEQEIRDLVARNMPPVVSARCLAVLFGYSHAFVNSIALQNYKYYRVFKIRKGKKKRVIQAPKVSLKVIQKWFGSHLSNALTFEDNVFGFIPEKSAALAAKQHTNARWVYSVDISDFFPSTPESVVSSSLMSVGYSEKASKLMAELCCYGDFMAQGSPASPVISNVAFSELDSQLKLIANEYDLRMTRYADDIVFSGVDEFPEEIKNQVKKLFETTSWSLSEEKEYFSELPKRLKVHGLLVHGDNPRLTKGYRNRIRAYKHLLANGLVKDKDLARIMGHVKYSESIDKLEE